MTNPWDINSIYDLQFYNCPSCVYKDQSKQEIIYHAYEFHPDSVDFLVKIKDDSFTDIICPWDTTKIKNEFETNIQGPPWQNVKLRSPLTESEIENLQI